MVTVRLYAAARDAVGTSRLDVPAGQVREICSALERAAPAAQRSRCADVLRRCTLLSDGARYRPEDDAVLPDGVVVDVMPPFAGG